MIVYIGADHGGFSLKEQLKAVLKSDAYEIVDVTPTQPAPDDDYPDAASAVASKVAASKGADRGILLCRSGFGVDIVADKFDGVRAALPMSPDHVYQGRHDDDVNVLAIAADFIDLPTALKMAKVFLTTPFGKDEKYSRRLKKIGKIEETN